jgi:hypothetical protein
MWIATSIVGAELHQIRRLRIREGLEQHGLDRREDHRSSAYADAMEASATAVSTGFRRIVRIAYLRFCGVQIPYF